MSNLARTFVALCLCIAAYGRQDVQSDMDCKITVDKAANLKNVDTTSLSDPYVKVYEISADNIQTVYKTHVVNNDLNPSWSVTFRQKIPAGHKLQFKVKDKDVGPFPSTFLGQCTYTPTRGTQNHECKLEPEAENKNLNGRGPTAKSELGTLFFTAVCQCEGEGDHIVKCPPEMARRPFTGCAKTVEDADYSSFCEDLEINVYKADLDASEKWVASHSYNFKFGIDFTIQSTFLQLPRKPKKKVLGFAPVATDDSLRDVFAVRHVTLGGTRWLVKIERAGKTRPYTRESSGTPPKLTVTAATQTVAPHKDTMVHVLASEVQLNVDLFDKVWGAFKKKLWSRPRLFLRIWFGPHIKIDTVLPQKTLSKKPFRFFFNQVLRKVNGNSGFQNFMIDFMASPLVGGDDIRLAQSRMYAMEELFLTDDVKSNNESTLDDQILHHEPQEVPRHDVWYVRKKGFVEGKIVLYSNDVLKDVYQRMFPDISADAMDSSTKRMALWENTYGDGIADQILQEGVEWNSYRDYAEQFDEAVSSRDHKPWASVTCAIALQSTRPSGKVPLSQKARDAIRAIHARTRRANVGIKEFATSVVEDMDDLVSPEKHTGHSTNEAIDDERNDERDDEDNGECEDNDARITIDYQQVESSVVADVTEPEDGALNDKIKKTVSQFMTRSLKRKWTMIRSAAFSAILQGLVPMAYAAASSPVGLITGLVGGTQRGMQKYLKLKQEMHAAEDHLDNSPLAMLDVCISFHKFLEYVLSHSGYIELHSNLYQFYLPSEKTTFWTLGQQIQSMVQRARGRKTREPISASRPETIKQEKVLVLEISREELKTLQTAIVFLMNLRYVDLTPADINAAKTMGFVSDGYSRILKSHITHLDEDDIGALTGSIAKIGAETLFYVDKWGDGTTNVLNDLGLSHAILVNDQENGEAQELITSLGKTLYTVVSSRSPGDSTHTHTGATDMMHFLRPKLSLTLLRLTVYCDTMMDAFADVNYSGPAHLRAYSTFERIVKVYNAFAGTKEGAHTWKERLYFNSLDAKAARRMRDEFRLSFDIFELSNSIHKQ